VARTAGLVVGAAGLVICAACNSAIVVGTHDASGAAPDGSTTGPDGPVPSLDAPVLPGADGPVGPTSDAAPPGLEAGALDAGTPDAGSGDAGLPPASGCPRPPAIDDGWQLVFADEFDGTVLDDAKWRTDVWSGAQCSCQQGALSCYIPESVMVSNGACHLQTNQQAAPQGHEYIGAIINTDTKYFFTYGYVDVRVKLPKGQGMWPAVWLYNPAYTANEIDIVEFLGGHPTTVYQTFHPLGGGQTQFTAQAADWSLDYHHFAVRWLPGEIVFYIDDVEQGRVTEEVTAERMYLMINNDVGGPSSWGGAVDDSTQFPNFVDVDCVHIYQVP
jgi:beta-glucanase (GH16 family)